MVTLRLIARCHWLFKEEMFLWVFFSYPDCIFSVRSNHPELQFLLFCAEERTFRGIRDTCPRSEHQSSVQHVCNTYCKGGEILVTVHHSGRVMAQSKELCLCHLESCVSWSALLKHGFLGWRRIFKVLSVVCPERGVENCTCSCPSLLGGWFPSASKSEQSSEELLFTSGTGKWEAVVCAMLLFFYPRRHAPGLNELFISEAAHSSWALDL